MPAVKICLCVIFNHNYEKNLPLLRQIYAKRFSNLLFLMPFYRGDDPDVIPYYEKSYYFQGGIAQAAPTLEALDATHYVFAGDDLMLNPAINEDNILSYLGGADTIALPPFCDMAAGDPDTWPRDTCEDPWVVRSHIIDLLATARGCEWESCRHVM